MRLLNHCTRLINRGDFILSKFACCSVVVFFSTVATCISWHRTVHHGKTIIVYLMSYIVYRRPKVMLVNWDITIADVGLCSSQRLQVLNVLNICLKGGSEML